MSNLNDKLNDSLLDIIGKAEQLGKNNARTQVLELFESIINKPGFEDMTSIEVIKWLTQAINMEHHIEMMLDE